MRLYLFNDSVDNAPEGWENLAILIHIRKVDTISSRMISIAFFCRSFSIKWYGCSIFYFTHYIHSPLHFVYVFTSMTKYFFFLHSNRFFFISGIWATRQMAGTSEADREWYVKTTIKELVIYLVFLTILCICK